MGNTPTITMSAADFEKLPAAPATGSTTDDSNSSTSFRTGTASVPTSMSASDFENLPSPQAPTAQAAPEDKTVLNDWGTMGKFVGDTAKDVGQGLVKALNDVGGVVLNAPSSIWHSLPPVALADSVKKTLPVINAYEKARSSGASISDAIKAADLQARQQDTVGATVKEAADEFKKNPTRESVRALGDAAALAALIFAGAPEAALPEAAEGTEAGEAAATATAPAPAEAATAPVAVDAEAAPSLIQRGKNLYQQITKGADVAQPAAQDAVRGAVQTASENAGTAEQSLANNIENSPLVNNNSTVLDEHLQSLRNQESDAYEKMDEVAGFDVKAEKATLKNDQYKLKQLGNTDADVAQREKLTASITDSEKRISDAEDAMKEADIDPKEADVLHQRRMAGLDFKKSLVKNFNAGDGTVKVEGLLNDAKNLRFSKYGDRLEQFFGSKQAANDYVADLKAANEAGVKALTRKQIATKLLKYGIPTTLAVGGGAYEFLK